MKKESIGPIRCGSRYYADKEASAVVDFDKDEG